MTSIAEIGSLIGSLVFSGKQFKKVSSPQLMKLIAVVFIFVLSVSLIISVKIVL